MLGAEMIAFFLKFMQLRFFKCNCEVSNYFFSGYNQDNQECYYWFDVFLVSETIMVRIFQRNQYCYCDYFILIVFNQVKFRLRLGCPGSLMSLSGPTFHVTPVDLCIIFQCNLYVSCIMSCVNKIVSNCFKIVSKLFQNCFKIVSIVSIVSGSFGHD